MIFPIAIFVHAVRDPRANVASRLSRDWGGDDVLSTAMKWRLDVSAARQFGAAAAGSESLTGKGLSDFSGLLFHRIGEADGG